MKSFEKDLRITGGYLKGKQLKVPDSARPVTTRVKNNIFDLIGEEIQNARVLDLFSGSGNLGLEALSRGAANAVFVDHNLDSVRVIEKNVANLKLEDITVVKKGDYKIVVKRLDEKFDIIFIDPPFHFTKELKLTPLVSTLDDNGLVVVKINKDGYFKIPTLLEKVYEKIIGENKVLFLRKS
jgi:16S rRNA (guanine966-N2)-methyltransferase